MDQPHDQPDPAPDQAAGAMRPPPAADPGSAAAPPRRPRPRRPTELPLYYLLVALYFFTFGMHIVLYPSLVTFTLGAGPEFVGIAQVTMSAPMFVFLMFGGTLAGRARAGPTLALLQAAFAIVMALLAWAVWRGALTYPLLITYGALIGTGAAFMLPVRDSALNGVVERDAACGRATSLGRAAATTAAVQIGAQIIGIVVARTAGAHPAPYLLIQAGVMSLGALLSFALKAPKPESFGPRTLLSAFTDIREGLVYAFKSPIMGPMIWSAAYIGVFVIGSFQVLFPLIVREAYGGDAAAQAARLSELFACFWGASFVSAAILSRLPPLEYPGAALTLSHLALAATLYSLSLEQPFWSCALFVLLGGLAGGVAISASRSLTQSAAEPRYLGRVLAAYSMGFMGGAPIGSAMVGVAAGEFGARHAALVPALGLALAVLALIFFSPIWKLRPSEHGLY
ncbi:MAG: MFS transporter [Hyphomonadaceae bacterium]|nr:MFS transporter [Hyphomonadaceae bacterium]